MLEAQDTVDIRPVVDALDDVIDQLGASRHEQAEYWARVFGCVKVMLTTICEKEIDQPDSYRVPPPR